MIVAVVVDVLLPGSTSGGGGVLVIVAASVMVPLRATTFSTSVNEADVPETNVARVHVIVPVAPTAGVVHDQPGGVVIERKVVPAGTAADHDGLWALTPP
jgi:hypothetical protein